MNNSKIWLVVKPTVGVPIFLGAVAVGSFAVHVAVLSSTGWVSDFLKGEEMGSSQSAALDTNVKTASADANAVRFYTESSEDSVTGAEEMVVVLPDGRMGKAVCSKPVAMASDGAIPPAE